MTVDLATLLADPTRAAEVPPGEVPGLLAAARDAHDDLAVVERALLARLCGATVGEGAATRARGDVTVAEFARLAGVQPGTVYDWIHQGRLTVKKRGLHKQSRVRIARSELARVDRVRRPRRLTGDDRSVTPIPSWSRSNGCAARAG